MKSSLRSFAVLGPSLLGLCLYAAICCSGVAWAVSSSDQPNTAKAMATPTVVHMVVIPGPLRSFMRMAAISQKVSPSRCVAVAGAQRLHAGLSARHSN